ncbi:MAG: hypothetical protein ACTSXZ_03060 [Alphaproteobacteria bacterium]
MPNAQEKIPAQQDKAILALIEEPSIRKAARATGVDRKTLMLWLQDDDFRRRYLALRRRVISHAIANLQRAMTEAALVLEHIALDKDTPAAVRVTAAKAIIDRGLKGCEIEDLAERIERLEAEVEGDIGDKGLKPLGY